MVLQKLTNSIEAFGAVPRKGKGRKWVAFGVVVKDGRDWMTAAKNMGKWHRGVERGAEALDSARLVKLYSKYVCDFCFCFVLLCFRLVAVVSRCFFFSL